MASDKFLVRNLAGSITEIIALFAFLLPLGHPPYRAPPGSLQGRGEGAGQADRQASQTGWLSASAGLCFRLGFRLPGEAFWISAFRLDFCFLAWIWLDLIRILNWILVLI